MLTRNRAVFHIANSLTASILDFEARKAEEKRRENCFHFRENLLHQTFIAKRCAFKQYSILEPWCFVDVVSLFELHIQMHFSLIWHMIDVLLSNFFIRKTHFLFHDMFWYNFIILINQTIQLDPMNECMQPKNMKTCTIRPYIFRMTTSACLAQCW